MIDIFDGIKTIGSIGGLISVYLLVYDRIIKSRPIGFISIERYQAQLVIYSVAIETLVIDEIKINPPIVKADKSDDMKSAKQDIAEDWYPTMADRKPKKAFIVLKENERRSFMLKRSADFENASDDQVIHIRLKWHSTRKTFLVPRYVWVRARVGDLKGLRDAALADKI
jgi:hypothetical protein